MRGPSRKSVLNLTSRKKRDTLLNYSNITASAPTGSLVYTSAPATLTGGSVVPSMILWCATGRDATASDTRFGTVIDKATRSSSTCFMRGLSENIEIQISDGMPWQWRRICFTYKGLPTRVPSPAEDGFFYATETNDGFRRVLNQPSGVTRDNIMELLFRGARSVDWQTEMLAPVDTERVTLKYDKTITIASGNDDGSIRKYKRWHGMNQNLVYDDEETGGDTNSGHYYSVQSKPGMGDYFVADFLIPRVGSTTANQLLFGTTSTLYWHEK